MGTYFANTFSASGLFHAPIQFGDDFYYLLVRGLPQSAVTTFLYDLANDLQVHDISVQTYFSSLYPDTPDLLIIPALKRVILNAHRLPDFITNLPTDRIEYLDLTILYDRNYLNLYRKSMEEIENKMNYYQGEAMKHLKKWTNKTQTLASSTLTREMLLLFQSLFPITAENKGEPEKVLVSVLSSHGWQSRLQAFTEKLKRRFILYGSRNFQDTFFSLAGSRAQNLKMACQLLIDPLHPGQIEGIYFPAEKQIILGAKDRHPLIPGSADIELFFDLPPTHERETPFDEELREINKLLIRAHSYREELDEYFWYTLDLDQLFQHRRQLTHQLLALCDGKELWQYFT